MKISIILLMSFCSFIPNIIAESDIERDIDFELYKHYDISPLHTHTSFDHDVDDFDDEHTTFDSTYDGGGSNVTENDDDDSTDHSEKKKSNDQNDDENVEENERTENDDENDDDNDDQNDENDDDEETADENKNEPVTIKIIDPKGTETVDPKSHQYISPDDVSHRLSRDKRSKKTDKENNDNDYDFARSYRDFVREHFGMEEAETLSDDANKKKKPKKQPDNGPHDNGEVEEDEDYEGEAEDGETEDDAPNTKGATTSPPAKLSADEYDDDDDADDNVDDDEETNDDDGDASSYEDDDYKNVKKLSQDTNENPEFCKTVYKDNQECQVCKNPKTHDKSETCSYSSSPTPKRYAYKKEKNYHSNDDPDDDDDDSHLIKEKKNKPKKKNKSKKSSSKYNSDSFDDDDYSTNSNKKKPSKTKQKSKKKTNKNKKPKTNYDNHSLTGGFQPTYPYYHGYQDRRTTTPLRNHYLDENNDDLSFRASESFPVTASSESFDKDIDIFKGRDWSQCTRKINKEGLTCYYCKDTHGATQEECMYIAGNDDDNPLKPKSNRNTKRNSDNKSKKKKSKKNKANTPQSTLTTTTTTSTTPKTLIPSIQFYDPRIIQTNFQGENNNSNGNIHINPAGISSVSWQTNHNQQPRILNRNQNFNSLPIPILRQNINSNPLIKPITYDSSGLINLNNNLPVNYATTIKSIESPVKTLEYTEPRNRETLKRMIKLKISNDDHNSGILPSKSPTGLDNDATVFYSKVLRKF